MLDQVRGNAEAWDYRYAEPAESLNAIDFDAVLAAARRQAEVIFAGVTVCLMLAAFYAFTATRIYTASADILIDSRTFDTTSRPGDQPQLVFDSGALDSQAEVLRSEKVLATVVDKLKLTEDPEFTSGSFVGKVLSRFLPTFGGGGDDTERQEALKRRAMAQLQRRLYVTRVDKTYVIRVSFSSPSRERAAALTNALAEAYLTDQLDAKYEATHRASEWLHGRIQELTEKSQQADLEVQKYRESHNLIAADGRLINDQQLGELNTQLTSARAERARAQARYNRIQSIVQNKQMDAAVAESLRSPVITELRNQYLEASKRASDMSERLNPQHKLVVDLKREMEGYERQIFQELGRIAESHRSDMEIAISREKSLRDSIAELATASAGDNRTLIKLHELERKAESYRTLHQDSLRRYQELIQRQSFPITEARIITRASPPSKPSAPRVKLVLAIGLVGGLGLGVGFAILREHRDRTFRTSDHVRSELGVEALGVVPLQTGGKSSGSKLRRNGKGNGRSPPMEPVSTPALMTAAVTMPMSRLADTLRTVKVAVDLEQVTERRHVIGVVSTTSGEGKTFAASNLAMLFGNMGANTLLIDGDLRQCGLSRALAPGASPNLIDVIVHDSPLRDTVRKIPGTKTWLLPTSTTAQVANSSQILGSPAMRSLLSAAASHFDYVVVDLPPLGALVDARAVAPILGSFLFVIEWGKTRRKVARNVLLHSDLVYEKCVGAILNKVDPNLLSRYAPNDAYSTYGYSSYEPLLDHEPSIGK